MVKYLFIVFYISLLALSASADVENIDPAFEEHVSRKRPFIPEDDSECQPPRMRGRFDSPLPSRPTFAITTEQREKMTRAGLTEDAIDKIALLSTAMLRSPHGPSLRLESYFSPSEIEEITSKLDEAEGFSIMLRWLKRLCPKKVLSDQTNIFSPAVRGAAFFHKQSARRQSFHQITESLAEEGMPVRSLAPAFFVAEDEAETEEERAERRAIQERLFTESESMRGITEEERHRALMDEATAWKPFLYYFSQRTSDINAGRVSCKITQQEIHEVFQRFLSDYYTLITVGDCMVYVRLSEIDPDRVNFLGETNRELLARGVAPIGADGKPMNMHHLTRRHPGALVLLTESFHQRHTDSLHLRSERHMRQPKPLDRRDFNTWKAGAFRRIHDYFPELSAASASSEVVE